jgi:predicted nucleic acid-binding protein
MRSRQVANNLVIVDTNVLAYLLIEGDQTPAAQSLWARDPDWRSESFIMIEFSNILATYVRGALLTREQGSELMTEAERLMPGLDDVEHAHALEAAAQLGISAYDARFLVLARRSGRRLVTEDAKLRRTAPDWTTSLAEAARAGPR